MLMDLNNMWDVFLSKIEQKVKPVLFQTWFTETQLVQLEDDLAVIKVPLDVHKKHLKENYGDIIKETFMEITGSIFNFKYVTENEIQNNEINNEEIKPNDKAIFESGLDNKYNFDNFISGESNKFAKAIGVAVAEKPGSMYNPLFIYGNSGLGKTHLMHSIAHFVINTYPQSRVLYVTSEEFTNELIESIRNSNNTAMTKFREKYRNIDVLLIDDVEFIIGKESTQEEFFHTFNALHSAKKQIVISSDKPPKDMEILEDRIRSRFEWGLIADISSPDYETRMAILRKKEELDGYNLDEEIIKYIATNVKSNIRELEGALNKLMAFANLEKQEVTLALAEQVLKDIISPDEKRIITPEYIINTVCEHFDVSLEDIKSNKRSSKIVHPRQIAMYLCRDMTDTALKVIGKYMGNRDHTTVKHGIEKIEKELQTSPTTQNTVEILKKKINPQK